MTKTLTHRPNVSEEHSKNVFKLEGKLAPKTMKTRSMRAFDSLALDCTPSKISQHTVSRLRKLNSHPNIFHNPLTSSGYPCKVIGASWHYKNLVTSRSSRMSEKMVREFLRPSKCKACGLTHYCSQGEQPRWTSATAYNRNLCGRRFLFFNAWRGERQVIFCIHRRLDFSARRCTNRE